MRIDLFCGDVIWLHLLARGARCKGHVGGSTPCRAEGGGEGGAL